MTKKIFDRGNLGADFENSRWFFFLARHGTEKLISEAQSDFEIFELKQRGVKLDTFRQHRLGQLDLT